MQPFNPLFSEEEVEYLREALEEGEGRPVSGEELKALLDWAGHVRLDGFLLDSILNGESDVRRRVDGRFASKQPRLQPRLSDEFEDFSEPYEAEDDDTL